MFGDENWDALKTLMEQNYAVQAEDWNVTPQSELVTKHSMLLESCFHVC